MSAVSIILTAKSDAKATFDRTKKDIKSFSDEQSNAMNGMKSATDAVSKAMSGDMVGAAQSAAQGFKSLWMVMMSNPLIAVGAAAATAAIGLFKLIQRQKEAKKAAEEYAKEIEKLRDEWDAMMGVETIMDKVAAKAKDMADAMDESGLRKHIQAIKDYKAELDGLADKQRVAMSLMTDKKQKQDAREEYDKLVEKLKTLNDAQKEYEGALKDVRTAQEEAAKAEQKAADQAAKNTAAQIEAERKLRMEIDETFARYENQWQKQQQQYLDDEAAFDKMVSRRKELEGATDALAKADLERKHILEDIEALMNAPEGAKTLEYKQLVEDLRLKEREIAQIQADAAAAEEKAAAERLAAAQKLRAEEEAIAALKGAGNVDPWEASNERRAKRERDRWDLRASWRERRFGGEDDEEDAPPDPSVPPVDVPPAGGALGGEKESAAPAWSPQSVLEEIREEVKALNGNLVGG